MPLSRGGSEELTISNTLQKSINTGNPWDTVTAYSQSAHSHSSVFHIQTLCLSHSGQVCTQSQMCALGMPIEHERSEVSEQVNITHTDLGRAESHPDRVENVSEQG